ncbi:hypothetical protein NDU88_000875 [Pleurodeles waltl]|uniref:Uncharacterized protein n=1 Tax=Pleurodeles waltl TaxID=8319 RepID=A0AAV7U6H8_PLEWA|nr:hypothetical protein NDU88_000875 [Pleurodeles waltl]
MKQFTESTAGQGEHVNGSPVPRLAWTVIVPGCNDSLAAPGGAVERRQIGSRGEGCLAPRLRFWKGCEEARVGYEDSWVEEDKINKGYLKICYLHIGIYQNRTYPRSEQNVSVVIVFLLSRTSSHAQHPCFYF